MSITVRVSVYITCVTVRVSVRVNYRTYVSISTEIQPKIRAKLSPFFNSDIPKMGPWWYDIQNEVIVALFSVPISGLYCHSTVI